jgi:ribosome-associated toxin RatA of RatAB toxin-antitoxin module
MGEVTQTIDVEADLQTVYNQWTQFEEFPRFMEGVERIEQIDDRRLRWTVEMAGVEREFDAEITEQDPDQRIAWKSTSGPDHAGVVTFHRLSDRMTRVALQMKFDPEGFVENVGDKLGFVAARTKGDLDRFKEFIEERQVETGGWRGEIDREEGVVSDQEHGEPVAGDPSPERGASWDTTGTDLGEADARIEQETGRAEDTEEIVRSDAEREGLRRFGS